jgi:hypothetical protein
MRRRLISPFCLLALLGGLEWNRLGLVEVLLNKRASALKQTEQYGGQRERNYKVRIVIANNMKIDRVCYVLFPSSSLSSCSCGQIRSTLSLWIEDL